MPKVKFYRDTRGSSTLCPIFFVLCHNYKKKSNYEVIGSSVPSSMWNDKAKGAPECIKGTSVEAIQLRDKLKTIKHQLEVDIPDFLFKEHDISRNAQSIDDIFNEFLTRNGIQITKTTNTKKYITEYIQEFIEIHGTYESKTLVKYSRLKETMTSFAKENNLSLLLAKVDYPWLSRYCNYLCEFKRADGKVGYENDYIETLFRKLNSTLNYYELEPFKVKKIMGHLKRYNGKETDVKELELADALKIYAFDCMIDGEVNIQWLKVRDLYTWSLFTGQRHNELFALSKYNIDTRIDMQGKKSTILKYVSDKTGAPNELALNAICMEIIERWKDVDFVVERTIPGRKGKKGQKIIYKDPLLPMMSDQKCNNYLHELLEEIAYRESVKTYGATFTRETQDSFEPIGFYKKKMRVRYVGSKRKEEFIPMWKYFTYKTSRTSTACVLADNGVSNEDIASLLNNDTETTKKYYARRNKLKINIKSSEVMDEAVETARAAM